MAPDRGVDAPNYQPISGSSHDDDDLTEGQGQNVHDSTTSRIETHHVAEGQHFSRRGVMVGLGVGLIMCFSNMYFGLQTGWVSTMSMPSSLIGFAFFKTLSKHLDLPFTPVENVFVQTVAAAMATVPLGCGFVGVMPALNYMMKPEENGPILLSVWKLIIWALGLCYFGVLFAVPLRKQVIIREKLKFPSGTATALMIGVLHGEPQVAASAVDSMDQHDPLLEAQRTDIERLANIQQSDWKSKLRLLFMSFAISGIYTFATFFFPILRNLPIFGLTMAHTWLWTFNPSFAYIGQGIIMGPATTTHMLLGAVIGWGILSPLAKLKGWAPGPVRDWEFGSQGWIVWISLAIMLADAIVSLGYIAFRPLVSYSHDYVSHAYPMVRRGNWRGVFAIKPQESSTASGYAPLSVEDESIVNTTQHSNITTVKDRPELDAPPEDQVNSSTVWIGLILSIIFCIACIRIVFGDLVPLYATIAAVFMALLLSIMGVRALGETDLNPVSGISKLAQLIFAAIIPQSNANSVLINLIAGAVSEAGALQAGDLMQDLKTGHILGAAPAAQFWGQMIGSTVGAVVSALIYKLYNSVYEIPGDLFLVPTGHVWIFTARLVTGKGLPPMTAQWAIGAAVIFTGTTITRMSLKDNKIHPFIPGGIAVAVGMYNIPSFTLARAIGGFVSWLWKSYLRRDETPLVILASGLILGEGVVSILNLLMASIWK